MTPRDHYAAAALQGILAAESLPGNETTYTRDAAVALAFDYADEMAAEACARWGHMGTWGTCGRCGEDLGKRPPPPPVRVPEP